ncbi:hypothetical protein KUTeg_010291 [Tegillarca granosa]|uniref:Fe2OG dioxygenase domain-containing protein n=1 Tax=Tegillarca granosa TaxID=220873 RepID=A0ABQ9F6D4_TEGGR|nr:hypothetical protein KUTeg_010291 [Tegillarca granosa]
MSSCSCKGIRTCITCEKEGKIPFLDLQQTAWTDFSNHPNHEGDFILYPGIEIIHNFVSPDEEREITEKIYQTPFVDSQSGRRKQDYGPKVNFKRKKLKCDVFTGLPDFSHSLYKRMNDYPVLKDFIPVEQCNLEYTQERGSAIDPHFDDFWLWGERLVTLNLLSDSVLCMTKDDSPDIEIHVPLTRRSLIVVYGPARNIWKHGIHRNDITQTRLAITFRELSSEFQSQGPSAKLGQDLMDIALSFKGVAVGNKAV